MNRAGAARLMALIKAGWGDNFKADEKTESFWQDALSDLPYAACETALRFYAREGVFPPKPADLRKIIADLTTMDLPSAEDAWIEVKREAKRCGINRLPVFRNGQFHDPPKPEFSHPIIAKTVEVIGWREICLNDKQSIISAQFIKTYNAYRDRAVRETRLGISDGESAGMSRLEASNLIKRLTADRVKQLPGGTDE